MPLWVVDRDKKGKPHLFGPFFHPNQMQDYIDSNLSGNARDYELNTINSAEATRQLKARFVKEFKNLDKGVARFSHPDKKKKKARLESESYLGHKL